MDCCKYALAARLDPVLVPVELQVSLFCLASSPGGYAALQEAPLFLTPYCAARLIHAALAHRETEPVAGVYEAHLSAGTGRAAHLPGAQALCALLSRAGVPGARVDAAVALALWHPRTDEVLDTVCPSAYAALCRVIRHEVGVAKRRAWGFQSDAARV